MYLWSFYSQNNSKFKTREKAIEYALNSNKPFKYTHGLGYRNPVTHNKLISIEEAITIMNKFTLLDIQEREDYIHLNTYTANDMW